MEEIIIRIKVDRSNPYDQSEVDLTHEVIDADVLLNELTDYDLNRKGLTRIKKTKNGNLSKKTVDELREFGWVHLETAMNREERKVLNQEYFLMDTVNKSLYRRSFEKIDLEKLSSDDLARIASGSKIVQVVSPRSVMSGSQYQQLQKTRQNIEKASVARKLAAKRRAAMKKEQAIEEARKLLQEEGEI